MPMFKSKKQKQTSPGQTSFTALQDCSSASTPTQNLSPYPAHTHPHNSDKFRGSYVWNDLSRKPVENPQGTQKSATIGLGEIPQIAVSPAMAPKQGSGEGRGDISLTTGKYAHTQNLTAAPPLVQQRDRERSEKRSQPETGRRESVMERTKADLYHASLINDVSKNGSGSRSSVETGHMHDPTSSPQNRSQPHFSSSSPHTSHLGFQKQSNNRSTRPTKHIPNRSPQHTASSRSVDHRVEKAAGPTLAQHPQIGRRASIMKHIKEDPYHALMLEGGTINGGYDSTAESSRSNTPISVTFAPSASPDPIPASAPRGTNTNDLKFTRSTARRVSNYSLPSSSSYTMPSLPDYAPPSLPNYATPPPNYTTPALPKHAPSQLPDSTNLILKNTILGLLPDFTFPSPPLPDETLPPLPSSTPSTPSSANMPLPHSRDSRPPSSVPEADEQHKYDLNNNQPPTSTLQAPESGILTKLPEPVTPRTDSNSNPDTITIFIDQQDPISAYLTPRALTLPSSLYNQITSLNISPADLDPETLKTYLIYLETGFLPKSLLPPSHSHHLDTSFDPRVETKPYQTPPPPSHHLLINLLILAHTLHDTTVLTPLILQTLEHRIDVGIDSTAWMDKHIVRHIFNPSLTHRIPEEVKTWVIERCIETRCSGLALEELPVCFLAGVLERVMRV
ncbi:hypothetical protein T440DRAFT_545029 [Plenodomus tracheiphilus IPT5]|uniref:Uncharacterized protein n=1 Tax=Plenodomus tracheiphilus IPT5 TaxID=1408161 RepID=A0A6A7AQE2_9PLEO|nr:hypothetical protein T440DRAFT_545029 [Plenodomus tracheiphilus IPT5]